MKLPCQLYRGRDGGCVLCDLLSDVCQVSEALRRGDAPAEACKSAAEREGCGFVDGGRLKRDTGQLSPQDHRLAVAM